MRIVLLYLCCLAVIQTLANPSNSEVRTLFQRAPFEKESCRKLVLLLEGYNEKNNALWAGYRACATMMMAKHVANPFQKLSSFYEGKELLEKSISADKNNIELRFLRNTIQTNAPSFLQYNHHIAADRVFLQYSVHRINDPDLKQLVINHLNSSPKPN